MLTIRLATAADHAAIIYVNRLSWQAAYKDIFSPEEISRLFKGEIKQYGSWLVKRNERLGVFLAEAEGKLIGFIGMASLLEANTAEITTFYLLPEAQGKGIGKQLWQTALQHLQTEGYTALWVWVLAEASARKFYEGRGCIEKAEGIYRIGSHEVKAIGYYLELKSSDSAQRHEGHEENL